MIDVTRILAAIERGDVRAVPEDEGTYTMFYTAYNTDGSSPYYKGYGCVGMVRLKLKKGVF